MDAFTATTLPLAFNAEVDIIWMEEVKFVFRAHLRAAKFACNPYPQNA
jgi:hypothetical protein